MRFVACKALAAGVGSATVLLLAIYLGSDRLRHFDPAVTSYALGSVAAAFALGYRLALFCARPPTWRYLTRAWQLFWRGGAFAKSRSRANSRSRIPSPTRQILSPTESGAARAVLEGRLGIDSRARHPATGLRIVFATIAGHFAFQNFIRRRSLYRWIMHLCLSGGGTLAFAITFPLVFGWVHFESLPHDAEIYRVFLFGASAGQFSVHGIAAFLIFNVLNFAALALLAGLVMAVARRLTDRGERAVQSFQHDFLPLIILAVVTITGLMLTVSYKWLGGQGHAAIGVAHLISVLVLLFYIPFGKLFHMVQRSVVLAVSLHKRARESGASACCVHCGSAFAAAIHVQDLKDVLDQLGFHYRFATPAGAVHYQDICPPCRRKWLASNQGRSLGR